MFSAQIFTTIICMGIVFAFGIAVGMEIGRCRAITRQMAANAEICLRLFTGRPLS